MTQSFDSDLSGLSQALFTFGACCAYLYLYLTFGIFKAFGGVAAITGFAATVFSGSMLRVWSVPLSIATELMLQAWGIFSCSLGAMLIFGANATTSPTKILDILIITEIASTAWDLSVYIKMNNTFALSPAFFNASMTGLLLYERIGYNPKKNTMLNLTNHV